MIVGQKNPSNNLSDTQGFDYRDSQTKEEAIGMIKDHNGLYAVQSPNHDRTKMISLRQSVRDVGQQFVQEYAKFAA